MKGKKGFQPKELNPMWVGDKISYEGIHDWIKNQIDKPTKCNDCNEEKKLDLANISQKYLRDLSDWEWLCRSCHMKKDGRLDELARISREESRENRVVSKETIIKLKEFAKKRTRGVDGKFRNIIK